MPEGSELEQSMFISETDEYEAVKAKHSTTLQPPNLQPSAPSSDSNNKIEVTELEGSKFPERPPLPKVENESQSPLSTQLATLSVESGVVESDPVGILGSVNFETAMERQPSTTTNAILSRHLYKKLSSVPCISVGGETLVLETEPGKGQATQNGLSEVVESGNGDDIRLAASSIPLPEIHVPKPPIKKQLDAVGDSTVGKTPLLT
jgi:hypothetical protein